MTTTPEALPEDTDALKAALIETRAKLMGAQALIEHLQLVIAKMKREMFGPRSERSQRLLDQLELQLEELVAAAGEDEAKAGATRIAVQGFTRQPATRRNFPADLPVRRIVHPAPTTCPCCGSSKLCKIGEDINKTLDVVPRQWFVTEHVREKFSCRSCETITQPPAPFHAIPRGFAGPSLLAMILVDKYANHQPLNRQSDKFACEGIELSVSTMADHVGACAATLLPLYELIKAHVFAAERIHGDDTTVPVLAKVKTRTGRLWTYVRDDRPFDGKAPPAAVFFYSPDRAGIHPEQHLAGYAGILQADCYAGFNALYAPDRKPGPITEAGCWAHYLEHIFMWSRCGLTGFWRRGHITSEGRTRHNNPHGAGDCRRVRGQHCRFRCGRGRRLRRTSPTGNGVMPTCQHAPCIHRAAARFPAMAVMHA